MHSFGWFFGAVLFLPAQHYQHVALCVLKMCLAAEETQWNATEWAKKKQQRSEPNVTTNWKGNENENCTKCAINNNQMKMRMRTALWLGIVLVKRCKQWTKMHILCCIHTSFSMYCCNAALVAGFVPHNDFHLRTLKRAQNHSKDSTNYRRGLQAAHKNPDCLLTSWQNEWSKNEGTHKKTLTHTHQRNFKTSERKSWLVGEWQHCRIDQRYSM